MNVNMDSGSRKKKRDWDSIYKSVQSPSTNVSNSVSSSKRDWNSIYKSAGVDIEPIETQPIEPVKTKSEPIKFLSKEKPQTDNKLIKGINAGFNKLMQSSNAANKVTFGIDFAGDRVKADEGRGTNLASDLDKHITYGEKTTGDKIAEGIGTGLGFLLPYGGAYKVTDKALKGTKAGVKALDGLKKLPKGSKYAEDALRGSLSGLQVGLATETRDEFMNPNDQTLGERAKDVGIETLLGGIGDPAIRGLGALGKQGIKKAKPGIENFIENLKKTKTQGKSTDLIPQLSKSTNENINLPKVDNIQSNKEVAAGKESSNLPKQEENIILSSEKKPVSLKETWNKFYENTFDTQSKFKNISKDTVIKGSNARQTQGVVDFIAQNGLVDKEGRKIGESLSELAQSIPKDKEKDFWRYVAHKHNVSRAEEGKNVFSQFSSEDSMKEAKKILSENPEFEAKGKNMTEWINKFMKNWTDDLVGKETLDLWKEMYPDYIPVNREMDPLKSSKLGNNAKKGFVNQNNLVKKAKGAKSDLSSDIKDPMANIASLVNKTVKASKNNEVGLEIVKEVRKGNLDEFFEIVPTKQGMLNDINKTLKEDGIEGLMSNLTEQFDDIYKQAEKGNNIVKVMENGKEVLLKVKDADYLKALKSLGEGTGESAAEQFERAARKVSRPIKDLITSKNPLFGVYNAARDLTASFIQGQEKNPIKFTNRYFKSLKEITSNSKGFQEFVAQGGMQSGFFKNDITKTVGKLKNPNASAFEKFIRKVEGFNNVIEAIPRYMEYMATLEKGGTKAEGIYNAAEVSVNFARSGKWGKFFDSFVLYLNPALQGIDKFVRQVKNKPLQTSLKAAGVITVPTIITDNANKDNPNYQALDQRIKDDFFLIPNKFGKKDEEGNAETFFKVPKTREYSVLFSVLVNRIGEITDGKSVKDASKGVGGSFNRNFSVPTRPIWAPFTDVKSNKDWKGAPINPLGMELDNRSNYLKYDEKTSEVGKMLSKLLNEQPIEEIKYSPKEIDYLLDSFTGIVGDLVLPATTKSESVSGVPKRKFVADSVYSNQEVTDFYNNLNKSRTAATDNNLLKGIPSSVKTKEERDRDTLNDISKEMGKINDLIRKSDEDKQRELRKEIIRLAKIGNDLYNQK